MSKPSLGVQLWSLSKAACVHIMSGLKQATEEEQKNRCEICVNCPEFISETNQCGVCRCFLQYKIPWATSKCPHEDGDKWKKENENK
jgi:hypothetical protein